MGYLIGGAEEAPEKEITASESDYSSLSDAELMLMHGETVKSVTKYSNFQQVRKICLNSLYGAIGNQYFRHYKLDNAEAITLTGQVAIRWIERKLNEHLNKLFKTEDVDYVIASDTDSVYLCLRNFVTQIYPNAVDGNTLHPERVVELLDKFSEKALTPFIDASYKELSEYLNSYEQTLVMKRECISEKGIWTAKKRYILNVWDNEGVRYDAPKLKMMGIEAVKSSTPAPCRKYIEECLNIIMRGTEEQLINYIETTRKEFGELPPEEIAFPRTANNIDKFMDSTTLYRKSTPMHIRASILFNHLIKQKGLENKYNAIGNGEKIKFVHLRTPNIIGENVIAFISDFPTELGLNKFVDYDTMYNKGFLDPLKNILDVIGWKTEKTNTLEAFFV